MKTFTAKGLNCQCTTMKGASQIIYILSPIEISTDKILAWAQQCQCNIAVLYGADWNNDLTPWASSGISADAPEFCGLASQFLQHLEKEVCPTIEKAIGYASAPQRTLVGISLSGLFALWAWMQDNFFYNICSISGSFWYPQFVEWLQSINIPAKESSPFFSLGDKEGASNNSLFGTVEDKTKQVIELLEKVGINSQFQLNPGNHFSPLEPRLDEMFEYLESSSLKIPA